MKHFLSQLLAGLMFCIINGCSHGKTTHTLYKGRIENNKKVIIKVSEIGGMKYSHIYRFHFDNERYDYWINFNTPMKKNSAINFMLEKSTYKGKKYIYTSYASRNACINDTTGKCIEISPAEYAILDFISAHLKEYNYENQFNKSSIRALKYWVRKP